MIEETEDSPGFLESSEIVGAAGTADPATMRVLVMVLKARRAKASFFTPFMDWPDGTNRPTDRAEQLGHLKTLEKKGSTTWRALLTQQVSCAYATASQKELKKELLGVAAVAVSWVEAMEIRSSVVKIEKSKLPWWKRWFS